ncbi:hypothetical protein DID88_006821 [Monilinia fructigena]|uniref:tetrahydrofolate synthase n=1 Tax=Monilinia fructigena TaxID=38457 RepID=A0A395IJ18_9HELO|nr:hypothetical protein DID88_006821 [Monilinia fructigena]
MSPSQLLSQCASPTQVDESQSSSQLYRNALHRLNSLRTNFESRQQIIGIEDRSFLLQQMCISEQPTCASLNSIGLYTSPHMRTVRERIRIQESKTTDFAYTLLDESKFVQYLSDIWDRLAIDHQPVSQSPPFAKFLTLMGLHAFIQEKVETAVVEVCIGGRYDSTNIIRQPSICAITSLGLEHTDILGLTIEEIAWAKGGIIKKGIPVFSAPQEPNAMAVLQDLARKEGADLQVVTTHQDIDFIELGPPGRFSENKCQSGCCCSRKAPFPLRMRLRFFKKLWQIMESAISQWRTCIEPVFHKAIFCTNILWERHEAPDIERVSMTYSGPSVGALRLQHELAACWTRISSGKSAVAVVRTVEEAIRLASNDNSHGHSIYKDEGHVKAVVLITGSLHLVGSAMEFLDTLEC